MKEAIDIRISPEYQRGYHDGYLEGYNKVFEALQKEFEKAYLSRPITVTVPCKEKGRFCPLYGYVPPR